MGDPVAPDRFRIFLEDWDIPIPDGWMTQTGGNRAATVSRFRDGNGKEQSLGSRATSDDLVVTREWIHERDLPILRWADRKSGKAKGTVIKQLLDEDDVAVDTIVYTARLTAYAGPDTDTNAGGDSPAQISLTLARIGELS